MFPRERGCIAPIMPVARHPRNQNSIIVADLGRISSAPGMGRARLERSVVRDGRDDRPGLKEVRLNRCPFVAPMQVLRPQDVSRLGFDLEVGTPFRQLAGRPDVWPQKISAVYAGDRVKRRLR